MCVRSRITPEFRETHTDSLETDGASVISPVARPAEDGRALITESVAQQPPALTAVGVTWFPGNLGTHPHDRQLTVLLAIEWISILVRFVVWTRWQ